MNLIYIRDTAGQERFRTITTAYYRGAMGIMLVYDVTNEKSFDNIKNWIRNIEENASADVEKMLLGNKCELNSGRQVIITIKINYLCQNFYYLHPSFILLNFYTCVVTFKHYVEIKINEFNSIVNMLSTFLLNINLRYQKNVVNNLLLNME